LGCGKTTLTTLRHDFYLGIGILANEPAEEAAHMVGNGVIFELPQ
jgi:hypothetical protein